MPRKEKKINYEEEQRRRQEREDREIKEAYREAKGMFCPYCGAGEMFSDMLEKHILEWHAPVHGSAKIPQRKLIEVIEMAQRVITSCKRQEYSEYYCKRLNQAIQDLEVERQKGAVQ